MRLGNKELPLPLIQGGMGVGVSLGGLAGAVASCGGMGTISTADIGFREPDFYKHPNEANLRALKKEIRRAKTIAGGRGLVAVNAMVATRQFEEAVRTAVAEGVDAVCSGAGLPLNLPELAGGADVLLAPIVSSGKAASVICRTWLKRYRRLPDFVVLEGPQAGGHLGFSYDSVCAGITDKLDDLLSQVREALRAVAPDREIPVFVAGNASDEGIMSACKTGGAAGIQVATPFIATKECDASDSYKQVLLKAKPEDLCIIHSPVGMPGRAVKTPLVQRILEGAREPVSHCYSCIKSCKPVQIPFCITKALIAAVEGNVEEGLFFSGGSVGQCNQMTTVPELVDALMTKWRNVL